MSLFDRVKSGLQKTRETTFDRITEIFSGGRLDESALEEIEDILLQADVGVVTAEELIDRIRELHKQNRDTTAISPTELLRQELFTEMDIPHAGVNSRFGVKPWVILLIGVNGSGKTTTAGKLAHNFRSLGKKVAIAAADTFRAAAVEQVEIWAKRGGARLIRQTTGADPGAVVFDAYRSVLSRGEDVLLIDTAGRLQDNLNLMQELGKISRIVQRFESGAPHEALLIIDATTGQNALSQARGFSEAAALTGLVITKLDGTARGGIVIPVQREMGIPVEFIGIGEGIDDLLPFEVKYYVDALLPH